MARTRSMLKSPKKSQKPKGKKPKKSPKKSPKSQKPKGKKSPARKKPEESPRRRGYCNTPRQNSKTVFENDSGANAHAGLDGMYYKAHFGPGDEYRWVAVSNCYGKKTKKACGKKGAGCSWRKKSSKCTKTRSKSPRSASPPKKTPVRRSPRI